MATMKQSVSAVTAFGSASNLDSLANATAEPLGEVNNSSNDYQNKLTNLIYKIDENKLIDKNDQVILFITTLILLKRLTRNYLFSKNMIYKTILGLFIISEKINIHQLYVKYRYILNINHQIL